MTFPSFHDPTHLYFITASTIGWKQLFIKTRYINIPLNSLAWMQQQKRILLFAFVIMPSHLHTIIKPVTDSIGNIVQQFGSFTAHEILKTLRDDNQKDLLDLFQQNKRDQGMNTASGRIFRQRTSTRQVFYGRKWNTFTKTQSLKIGNLLKTGQITFIQARDIMITEEKR